MEKNIIEANQKELAPIKTKLAEHEQEICLVKKRQGGMEARIQVLEAGGGIADAGKNFAPTFLEIKAFPTSRIRRQKA